MNSVSVTFIPDDIVNYNSIEFTVSILVNSVTPGPFPSEQISKNLKFINDLKAKTCLGRVGKPEDVAGVFVLLSSAAAGFITGQNFVVDGGWTIK
jgi:NAD(P)-dependent dehydrogenase (short-subunit alcohol dehydrogenase family)